MHYNNNIMQVTVQKINKQYNSTFDFARAYYTFILNINNISLGPKEIDFLSYCAIHGSVSIFSVREGYMKEFNVPKASLYNMISKLQKKKLMIKVDSKIRINPAIQLDFTKPICKVELLLLNKDYASNRKD